ncbi:hypothetical protein [Sphingopyxis panaciterrae]
MIRFGRPTRSHARLRLLALSFLAFAGACSAPDDDGLEAQTVVLHGETRSIAKSAAAPKPDIDGRIAPPSPGAIIPHRDFTDPPLPPELRDDGGLDPLPPRPAPSAMAGEMQPTFQAPQ